MRLLLALTFIVAVSGGPTLAGETLQQGRSVALCSGGEPVCAYMRDGSAAEMSECQARRDDAVRILPGACWDAD